MSRYSKQIVFAVLNVLLMALLGCLVSDEAQASPTFGKRAIYLQATRPIPNSQSITPLNLQPQLIIKWLEQHPSVGGLIVAVLLYLGVLRLRPTWLLVLPLDKIPRVWIIPETPIPPEIGLFLKYRPRVLDAWVNQRIAQAQAEFNQRPTVRECSVHIPIPVELNGNKPALANFSVNDLKIVFSKRFTRLLIVGEGGVGKTSLACQIAKWAMAEKKAERLCKHRMLPVLIEEELEPVEGKSPLLEAIARQVKNLRDEEKPVSEELLKRLLEKRRILVIVDHLSEMSEATRKATRLRDVSSPVNALVVTSRIEDILGKEVTHTTLKPQRVSGKQLSIFMDAYLAQQGKRDLFDDVEYFDALRRLSQIVTDKRDITVLFAKLYADQMIEVAEGLVKNLPDNVPDLMLRYINEVNREKDGKMDDNIVQRDLKAIAWECLKQTFKPDTSEREQVIKCLTELEGEGETAKEGAKKRLKYLEERLALIRTVSPAKIKIRFALDPLAEYLAGLYLVNLYGEDEQKWKEFLDEARKKPGTLEEIRGFLISVRDCCLARVGEAKIPGFVVEELGDLASLNSTLLKREQLKRRIQRLIFDLSLLDEQDRAHAVDELGHLREIAKLAIPSLVKASKDSSPYVRKRAVIAVAKISPENQMVISVLADAAKDQDDSVCEAAVYSLGYCGLPATPYLVSILDGDRLEACKIAVIALGNIGLPAISPLIKALKHKHGEVRGFATVVIGNLISGMKVEVHNEGILLLAHQDEDVEIKQRTKDEENAVNALQVACQDEVMEVRTSAKQALLRIQISRGLLFNRDE